MANALKKNIMPAQIKCGFGFFAAVAAAVYFGCGAVELLAAAAVHELGHMAAMAVVGKSRQKVTLTALGILIEPVYETAPSGCEETVILIAGPLAGIAAAILAKRWFAGFFNISMALSLMNMLPLNGLDGGGIFRIIWGKSGLYSPALKNIVAMIIALCMMAAYACFFDISIPRTVFTAAAAILLLRHAVKDEYD